MRVGRFIPIQIKESDFFSDVEEEGSEWIEEGFISERRSKRKKEVETYLGPFKEAAKFQLQMSVSSPQHMEKHTTLLRHRCSLGRTSGFHDNC